MTQTEREKQMQQELTDALTSHTSTMTHHYWGVKIENPDNTTPPDRPMIKAEGENVVLDMTFVIPEGYKFVVNYCVVDTGKRMVTPIDERAEFGLRKKATP